MTTTLCPAYGRDYKTSKAVIEDFRAGKDFMITDIMHPYNTCYASVRDFAGQEVKLRYNKCRDAVLVTIDK